MAVMSFLAGLPSEFETAKSQILSNSEIGSLQEVFNRILRTEGEEARLLIAITMIQATLFATTVMSRAIQEILQEITNHNQRNQIANVATASSTSSSSSDKTVMVLADGFAKFSQYQESLKISTSVTALVETGKTCLISSSNKWVIDSGATNHMIGNPKTFSSFQSHLAPSPVTIADGVNL
ncbi:hypothetical protein CK203_056154 [Vitis vinifera]|uniref:Retrovirus-related Pol polyprotein from transposon TNT 1-94-like beta-barrel domain-containing protein n=1 Tax=Vitis vinifera TaxID=29760 RepID=A0A438GE90_VITVI|nr:hypothetical protein CK203_056154 [Vitis vinifera]